jgi:PDZ domain-containing protein
VKRLFAAVVLVAAGAAVLFLVPSDHYVFLPDPARPVDPLVRVPAEERGAEGDGGIYMVDILVRKANLLERVFPQVTEGASLVPPHAFNPTGQTDAERRRESFNQMSRSQEIAVTVALRSLGYRVRIRNRGAEVASVLPDMPAHGMLEVGDVIVRARGRRVRSRNDLLRAMRPIRPGDRVGLELIRDGERRQVRLDTVAAEDDRNRAVFGIVVVQAADFTFPVDVEIDAGDIGGPSAGLAFALDVVDELGREVDRGRRIAVTGTLELDGSVGTIGGVKQKAIGAREADADVFIVPDGNAAEARRHAEGLRVVAVSSFREALSRLRTR